MNAYGLGRKGVASGSGGVWLCPSFLARTRSAPQSEPLDALLHAMTSSGEAARSSGQAVTRVSDLNTRVEHQHTQPREKGKGLPAKYKPSGRN
eukprot:5643441-Pleurochrysis_carterae.AAC.3